MITAYVFSVIGDQNGTMATIYTELASSKMKNEQSVAIEAIRDWIEKNAPEVINMGAGYVDTLDKLAYNMRKNGVAWLNDQYGFCLTTAVG